MRSLWQILTNPELRAPRWLRLPKQLLSIRASILLVYLLVVGGGFYAIMSTLIQEIQPRYLESMEESLVDTVNILASLIERETETRGYDSDAIEAIFDRAYSREFEAHIYSLEKSAVDLQVYLTDQDGRVLYHSSNPEAKGENYSRWRDVNLTLKGEYGARATWVEEPDRRELLLFVAAPVRMDDRIVGVVTVGKPTTYVNELVDAAEKRFRAYAIAAGIAVLGLGAVLSVWLTRPIKRLIEYATDLRDGKPAQYPRLFGIEANNLGRAFEEMREALEGKQYIERYVQSLTHQLKSPLSGISGAAELMEGEMTDEERLRFAGNVRRESERMRRIVDRMLELAAVESRRGLQKVEEIDLGDIVEAVADDLRPQLASERIECVVTCSGSVTIEGERFLVRQAVFNLLQNAIDFSPAESEVRVEVSCQKDRAIVDVNDGGPGIPEYALAKVTDRFYSLVRPKSGEKSSGIGLSFVKEIMALHGGELQVENRESGGVRARLVF